jgi:hypothetical protein
MPQKRISICTSVSVGSRRAIVVDASGDVALAAEKAFALYMALLWMQHAVKDMQKHAILLVEFTMLATAKRFRD